MMDGVDTNPRHVAPRNAFAGLSLAGLRAWKSWFIAFPGVTQWHFDEPALLYRCGGSAGIDCLGLTGFPFHPARKTMRGHHERGGV
jgi:hypothetical protein